MEGKGWRPFPLLRPPLGWEKRQRGPSRHSVSADFVADCIYIEEKKSNFAQELNYAKDLPFSDVKPDTRTLVGGGGGGGNDIIATCKRT